MEVKAKLDKPHGLLRTWTYNEPYNLLNCGQQIASGVQGETTEQNYPQWSHTQVKHEPSKFPRAGAEQQTRIQEENPGRWRNFRLESINRIVVSFSLIRVKVGRWGW